MSGKLELLRRSLKQQGSACLLLAVLLLGILGNGCTRIPRTMDQSYLEIRSMFSAQEAHIPIDPVELQDDLLRFADDLTSTVLRATSKLERDGAPIAREDLLMIWIAVNSEVVKTATGSNSLASLVNMIVITTAMRMRVERYWMPQVYGESAGSLLAGLANCERDIWHLGDELITLADRQKLLSMIEQLVPEAKVGKANPAGFASFASASMVSEIVESNREKTSPLDISSLFSLLEVDPLAGLDPATRELAQTRLLAERAMFIGVRMPQVIQWQAELIAIRMVELLQVEEVVANSDQIAAAMDSIGRLADEFPDLLHSATGENSGLTNLSREIGLALAEGTRMAESTDAALGTFDSLMTRFEKPEDEPARDKEPFRIQDYAETAEKIGKTVESLRELLTPLQPHLTPEGLATLSTAADAVAAKTQARGRDVVDYAFVRGLQLVAAVLLAALLYRALSAAIGRFSAGTAARPES